MKKRIAVLISGNGSNLQAIIDAVSRGEIEGELVLVISNKQDAYGLERAKLAGIETKVLQHTHYSNRNDFDRALLENLEQSQVNLIVLAGFMRILTPEFVEHFAGKILNIHPSLLPKYKGLDTHQRAIDAGDEEHGCSVHFVTPELDGGPVALQAVVAIAPTDDVQSLQHKVHKTEHIAYPKVVKWFCCERLQSRAGKLWLDDELLSEKGFQLTL
ncbi:MAG: phosphoribosylglycinamide formyltransferase-1 [Oceanospirillaceae bacterium]|jgi:phosphoribosylglycinamide formyltransferase-1